MKEIFYRPEELFKGNLDTLEDNVKIDRCSEDLLFQIMLDKGIELSSRIDVVSIENNTVHIVDNGFLVACFDLNLSENTIEKIAKLYPNSNYAVFRNGSFSSDTVISNSEQIFKTYSRSKFLIL